MKKPFILAASMNPTLQKTLVLPGFFKDTVNRTREYRLDTAGKGLNVSRVLTQLGKECRLLTPLGGFFRPLYLEFCAQDRLRVEWVESSSQIRLCYTIIDKSDKSVTELIEEAERVEEGTEKRLLDAFSPLVPECGTLIISGTKAPGFSDELIPEMVRQARAAGSRIILDICGKDLINSLPHKPDIIKPNLYEFISTFAPEIISNNKIQGDEKEIKKRVGIIWAELREKYNCTLVLTRGANSVWYTEKEDMFEFSFNAVEPVNTIGSGDAFTAGFAAALEQGASIREAVAEGVRCGALNAGILRPGVIKQ